jgi:hypothetical protein
MSKRSERRAAERAQHKAARAQSLAQKIQPAAQPEQSYAAASQASAIEEDFPSTPTISEAQLHANRANAQLSTGPRTPEGRATVSQNRRTHGLLGRFALLPDESCADYEDLVQSIYEEHNPESDTEFRLANSVIQHYWLMQRAVRLQEELLHHNGPLEVDSKKLALFIRYQATHERSYYRAQKELQKLRKERQKEANGFESQKRQQEAHEARVRLTHAKAQNLEIDTACRQVMEAPIPGNTKIGFEQLTHACSTAIATMVYENQFKTTD